MSDTPLPEADALDGAPHPRLNASLIGQSAAEEAFLAAFSAGRLHHGWLLTGPKGIGKATFAWRIARFLMAEGAAGDGLFAAPPTNLQMSAEDPVFHRVANLSEPGIALCRRRYDEKTKKFKTALTVDEIRSLKSFFTLSSADGGWRVAIIDAADEMNTSAANALLKILEEPPPKAILLLVAHQPARLLPTIRSRCRVLPLSRLSDADVQDGLALLGREEASAEQLALAEGSLGAAVQLSENGGAELYAQICALLASPQLGGDAARLALAEHVAGGDRANLQLAVDLISRAIARAVKSNTLGAPLSLEAEARVEAALCPHRGAAQAWAALLPTLRSRSTHAISVNLDPQQVLLDQWHQIERTARGLA